MSEEIKEEPKKKIKIIEAADLPEGEKVYLKKDFIGWRVVEPMHKDISKPANLLQPSTWKNINWTRALFGGKKNVIMFILLMLVAGIIYLGFEEQVGNYKAIAASPCAYCKSCQDQTNLVISQLNQKEYKSQLPIINST